MPDPSPQLNSTPSAMPATPVSPQATQNVAAVSAQKPMKPMHHDSKCGKNCDQCLKGGMPVKREFLSFLVIILVGLSTLLAVLYVNAKRDRVAYAPTVKTEETSQADATYGMPAMKSMQSMIDLPVNDFVSSVDGVIGNRRSRRTFAEAPLSLENLGKVLWAAQGVTDQEHGYRAAPSAKGAYPYTLYVVVRNVEGLDPGLYEYVPDKNQLGSLGVANAGELQA